MANQQALPANETQQQQRQALVPIVRSKLKNLADVNVRDIEAEIGMMVDERIVERAYAFENYVYCVFLAERERLEDEGVKLSTAAMLGVPGGKSLMRGVLRLLWDKSSTTPEYRLRCQAAPGAKTLPIFELFLNEAVPLVVQQDYVGGGKLPPMPKYKVVGIGKDVDSRGGHNKAIVDAIKARYAEQRAAAGKK